MTNVELVNSKGDIQHGTLRHVASDEPPVIRVGSTELYVTTWNERGWVVQS